MKLVNGYPKFEVYGLKIRSSEDMRLEIDVNQRGKFVGRIYVEFNFEENYAHVYTHNGEVDQKMPFRIKDFDKFAAATLGRKGGQSRSEAKIKAVRENGKLGGRPRKIKEGEKK